MRIIEISKVFLDKTNVYLIAADDIKYVSFEGSYNVEIRTSAFIIEGYSKRENFNDLKAFIYGLIENDSGVFQFTLYDLHPFQKMLGLIGDKRDDFYLWAFGDEFYPGIELGKIPDLWNKKHPDTPIHGYGNPERDIDMMLDLWQKENNKKESHVLLEKK